MDKKNAPLLEIKNITKVYNLGETKLEILKGVNLTIEEGDFVAIMGPSGSGKSTLMHILGLFDQPTSGEYKIYGQNVLNFNDDQTAYLRSKLIGFVFQQYNLLPRMTALDNVALPLIYSRGTNRDERATKLLTDVWLDERLDHKPNQLSGGQQQRVAIARSLVNNPKIIFADEPTGNLASVQSNEIMQILKDLNRQGISVILVTHEQDIADWANRVITIKDGQILADERKSELIQLNKEPLTIKQESAGFTFAEFKENFLSAIRSIVSNKTRSILTMLGVIIGVASIIAMLALGKGAQISLEEKIKSMGANIVTLMPGRIQVKGVSSSEFRRITIDDAYYLAQNEDLIKNVDPNVRQSLQVVYKNKNTKTDILGTTSAYESMQNATPMYGRFFTKSENERIAKVALLGQTVIKNLFGDENPVGKYIKIDRKKFLVVGVLPFKGASGPWDQDDKIIVPIKTAMKRLFGGQYINSIVLEAKEGKTDEVQKYALTAMLERYRLGINQLDSFRIRTTADMIEMLSTTTKTMTLLLGAVAGISLIVGGIGIMNIMLVSVSERTREIGLRKAIGATKKAVLLQFLIESAFLSVLGGVIGIILGMFASILIAKVAGWTLVVSNISIFLSVGFSVGIGIIFGFWPAKKASELSPIEALRSD